MKPFLSALLLCASAAAAEFAPAASVSDLASSYTSAIDQESKLAALEQLAQTPARSEADVRWLLNLYSRPESQGARRHVEASLRLLSPADQNFAPFFTALLKDEDPFLQMFGVLGALQVRSAEALKTLTEVAERKFRHAEPSPSMAPGDVNRWQVQFASLQALAAWKEREALPILEQRVKEAPAVAGIIAMHFWEEYLPKITSWSESKSRADIARGEAAWRSVVPVDKLRATAPALRAIVVDRKKKRETRHSAALKLGPAATDEVVAQLLEDYEAAQDQESRLIVATALFASRNPAVVPLLEKFAKTDPSPTSRAGALLQLKDMVPPERYKELLQWAAASDPDEENRVDAARQLKAP